MSNNGFYDIQYKANAGQVNLDQAQGIVECFVAGIGNKDSVGDVCASGAFTKSLMRRKPRVVWGHNWNDPIGKVLEIYEVPPNDPRLPGKMKAAGIGGLYARVQFNLNSEKGREAFANVAFFGEEQEWSIGYKTIKAQFDQQNQANILYEVELYEVSPVLHGANQLTGTISVKNAEKGGTAVMPMPASPVEMPEEDIQRKLQEQLSAQLGGKVKVSAVSDNHVMFSREGDEENMYKCRFHHEDGAFMFGQPQRIVMPMTMPQAPKPQQMPQMPMGMPSKPIQPAQTGQTVVVPAALPGGNPQQQPLVRISYSEDGSAKKPEGKPKLVQEEADLANALLQVVKRHGKFNEDSTGVWAGYKKAAENPVAKIGVKCANCVMYEGEGNCKIIAMDVEEGGKCRFAIIPEGVVQVAPIKKQEIANEKEQEEVKWLRDIEAKFPEEFLSGDLRMALKLKREALEQSVKMIPIDKYDSKSLESNAYFYVPVEPKHAFEMKQAIDPIIDFYRADAYVEDGGIVFTSGVNKDFAEAIDTAVKALGRNLAGKLRSGGRGLSARFNPNAWDGDNDGIVQEGTPFQRPAIPGVNDFFTRGKVNKRKARQAWEQYQREGKPKVQKKPSSQAPRPSAPKPARGEDLTPSAPRPGAGSGRKRSLTRHSNRDPKFEAQMPDRAENAKRESHEALIQAWEQGMGMPFTPIERQVGEKGPRFTEDWLRGRELGYNDAKARWMGKGTSKRPSTFKENQKSSVDYANWFMNVVGQLGMDKRDRDRRGAQSNYDNEGIDAGIKTFLMENAPTPQSDELQKRINDTLKDAGFERGRGLSSGAEYTDRYGRDNVDRQIAIMEMEMQKGTDFEDNPASDFINDALMNGFNLSSQELAELYIGEDNFWKQFLEENPLYDGDYDWSDEIRDLADRILEEDVKTEDVIKGFRKFATTYSSTDGGGYRELDKPLEDGSKEHLANMRKMLKEHSDYEKQNRLEREDFERRRALSARERADLERRRDNEEQSARDMDRGLSSGRNLRPIEPFDEIDNETYDEYIKRAVDQLNEDGAIPQGILSGDDGTVYEYDPVTRLAEEMYITDQEQGREDYLGSVGEDRARGLSSGRRRTPTTEELESTLGFKLSRLVMPARLELEESRRKKARTLNQDEVGFSGEFIGEDYPLNYRGNDPRELEEITYITNGEYSVASPSKFIGNTVVFSDGRRGVITSSLAEPYAENDEDFVEDLGLVSRVAFAPGKAEIMITHDKDGTLLKSPERFVGSFDGTADNGLDIEEYFEPDRWPNRFAIEDNKVSQETVDDLKKVGGSRRGLSSGRNTRERGIDLSQGDPVTAGRDLDALAKRTDDLGENFRTLTSSENFPGGAVRFSYAGRMREIYPESGSSFSNAMKVSKDGSVYFVGSDPDAEGIRSFRLDRIEGLVQPVNYEGGLSSGRRIPSPRESYLRGQEMLKEDKRQFGNLFDEINKRLTDAGLQPYPSSDYYGPSPRRDAINNLMLRAKKVEPKVRNMRRNFEDLSAGGERRKEALRKLFAAGSTDDGLTDALRSKHVDSMMDEYNIDDGETRWDEDKFEDWDSYKEYDPFISDVRQALASKLGVDADDDQVYDELGDLDPEDYASLIPLDALVRVYGEQEAAKRKKDLALYDLATELDLPFKENLTLDQSTRDRVREISSGLQGSRTGLSSGRSRYDWGSIDEVNDHAQLVSRLKFYAEIAQEDKTDRRALRETFDDFLVPGFIDTEKGQMTRVRLQTILSSSRPEDQELREKLLNLFEPSMAEGILIRYEDRNGKRTTRRLYSANQDRPLISGIVADGERGFMLLAVDDESNDFRTFKLDRMEIVKGPRGGTRNGPDERGVVRDDRDQNEAFYGRTAEERRRSGLSSGRNLPPIKPFDEIDDQTYQKYIKRAVDELTSDTDPDRMIPASVLYDDDGVGIYEYGPVLDLAEEMYITDQEQAREDYLNSVGEERAGGLSSGSTVDKARNQALQDSNLRELFKESNDYYPEFQDWVDSLQPRKRRGATEEQWERTTAYADALLSYENRLADQADRIADRRSMGLSSGGSNKIDINDEGTIVDAIANAIDGNKPKLSWRDVRSKREFMTDEDIGLEQLDILKRAIQTRNEILSAYGIRVRPGSTGLEEINIDDLDERTVNAIDELEDFINKTVIDFQDNYNSLERRKSELSKYEIERDDAETAIRQVKAEKITLENDFNDRDIDEDGDLIISPEYFEAKMQELNDEEESLGDDLRRLNSNIEDAESDIKDFGIIGNLVDEAETAYASNELTPREQRRRGLSSGRRDLTDDEIEARNEYMREGMLDQVEREEDDFIRSFRREPMRDQAKIAVAYRKETGRSANPKDSRFRKFAEEMIAARDRGEEDRFDTARDQARGLSSGARSSGRIGKVADQMFDDYVSGGRIDVSTEELADKYGVSDLVAERARKQAQEYIDEVTDYFRSLPDPTDEELQAMADDYERRGLSSGRNRRTSFTAVKTRNVLRREASDLKTELDNLGEDDDEKAYELQSRIDEINDEIEKLIDDESKLTEVRAKLKRLDPGYGYRNDYDNGNTENIPENIVQAIEEEERLANIVFGYGEYNNPTREQILSGLSSGRNRKKG